jgi:hypothetical protein
VGPLRRVSPRFLVVLGLAALSWAQPAQADEPRRLIDMSRMFDAGAPAPDPTFVPTPPDPPPLVERAQWVFDLRWDRGDAWLLGVRKVELAAPQATPRAMGRFALELFEGRTLIERVRFDFPLLAVPDVDGGSGALALTQKLRTRVGVVFPASPRGTRLELWDRATGHRWSLPWPVESAPPRPAAADTPNLVP